MPFDWQTTVALTCVALATADLARRGWLLMHGNSSACGDCPKKRIATTKEPEERVIDSDQIQLLFKNRR